MDKYFAEMSALLHAVWPAVSNIDWSEYCDNRVSAYDDAGVPKYTGLLMHRSGGGCVGATTVATGFLARPEKSAIIVAMKTGLLTTHPSIAASMELRNPDRMFWGGGIRSSEEEWGCYAITGLPEIGDHLLMSQMMREYKLLTNTAWKAVVAPKTKHMTEAREYVSMSSDAYIHLRRRVFDIVSIAAGNLRTVA